MSAQLSGKIALITGGTTGLGLATAITFRDEGAKVYVTGRNPETLKAARLELGEGVEVVQSDAGDPQAIKDLISRIKKEEGQLDVLFVNAGIAHFAPISDTSLEMFDKTFNINVRGPWLLLKSAGPLLSEGASVILNASAVIHKGMAGASAYAASKAALRSLARTASAEWIGKRIRVNTISPGPFETPIFSKMGLPEEAIAATTAGLATQVPLGRLGRPEELAKAALFLASDASSFVVGQELLVDGGMASL